LWFKEITAAPEWWKAGSSPAETRPGRAPNRRREDPIWTGTRWPTMHRLLSQHTQTKAPTEWYKAPWLPAISPTYKQGNSLIHDTQRNTSSTHTNIEHRLINFQRASNDTDHRQGDTYRSSGTCKFNPLNAELTPICYLLALLEAHHFLHVSRIRVK
jgi:hypothetical protein